jgi:hypothetical protein
MPYTSSASAQASEGSISASNWRFRALASSAWWRGKHSQSSVWHRRWKRAPWLQRLCGRMSRPSTASRGAASWICSLRDTRVSHSRSPGNVWDRTILGISGRMSPASLAKWARDGSSSRTSQGTFDWASSPCEPTFDQWAIESRRDSSRRLKSARLIYASGSLLWPTAVANDAKSAANRTCTRSPDASDQHSGTTLVDAARMWLTPNLPAPHDSENTAGRGGKRQRELADMALLWPTPNARVSQDGESPSTWMERRAKLRASGINGNGSGMPLTMATAMWPTPKTPSGGPESRQSKRKRNSGGVDLQTASEIWQTPQTPGGGGTGRSGTRRNQPLLDGQARMWRTPKASDAGHAGPNQADGSGHAQLAMQADCLSSHPDQLNSKTGHSCSKSTRRLNPRFTSWLMGLPHGLTSFELTATESCRYRQRMRSYLCWLVTAITTDQEEAT